MKLWVKSSKYVSKQWLLSVFVETFQESYENFRPSCYIMTYWRLSCLQFRIERYTYIVLLRPALDLYLWDTLPICLGYQSSSSGFSKMFHLVISVETPMVRYGLAQHSVSNSSMKNIVWFHRPPSITLGNESAHCQKLHCQIPTPEKLYILCVIM